MDLEMTLISCASCSIPFALSDDLIGRLRKSHDGFCCPMGHRNVFPAKTDEEKLREQLRAKSDQLTIAENQVKHLQESIAKKTTKRAKKVVTK